MPDRRQLLQGVAGMALARHVPVRTAVQAPDGPGLRAIVRQDGRFGQVDPRSGDFRTIDLPASAQGISVDPASLAILIELGSGAWQLGRTIDEKNVAVQPVPPDTSPVLLAGRVIGAAPNDHDVIVHDLFTGRSDGVSGEVLPGPTRSWDVHRHPVLPAALIDARGNDGGIVLLAAGARRMPWIVVVPPGSAVGVAPDGLGWVQIDRVGGVGAMLCVAPHPGDPHDPAPRLSFGTATADVLGPIGVSGNELLTMHDGWVPVVSCEDSRPHLVDEAVINSLDGRSIDTWFASPGGEAMVLGLADGPLRRWAWWKVGQSPVMLPELPPALEPGVMSGGAGRWFHGAELTETSLGSGELRLMALDMSNGQIVFDHSVDRRLELAATGISADGSLLAHCQSGNAAIELLVVSLHGGATATRFRLDIQDAPVAAAEITLDVAGAGGQGIVAAGLQWGNPAHHGPMVITCAVGNEGPTEPVIIDGELIGVIPAEEQRFGAHCASFGPYGRTQSVQVLGLDTEPG